MKAERKYYWGRTVNDVGLLHEMRETPVRILYHGICTKNGTLKAEDVRVWWSSNGEEALLNPTELKEVEEYVQERWESDYTLYTDLHWEKM